MNNKTLIQKGNDISHIIVKKYRFKLWNPFIKAIKQYQLIQPNDRICVCISGGKDSMLMAKLFSILHKYTEIPFDVEYLVMNPGYNQKNLDLIKYNLNKLEIPAKIVETNIFAVANMQTQSPCYLCAKMRRGALYRIAKDELNCNKIALGHHYDDVIETTLMNMLNAGSFQTMLPKLHSENYPGMELIRPLYLLREKDIIQFKNYCELEFLQCACKFTEQSTYTPEIVASMRKKTKELIKELMKNYSPTVDKCIFRAACNVNMDLVLGYKKHGKMHTFLDEYNGQEGE